MSRLTRANTDTAMEIISRYPRKRSALIPLLHLAQEQDGHVTDEAMRHIAELVDCTPAEVIGTSSFYEMLKPRPVGRYMVNVCTDIACMLVGGQELLEHAEETLGIHAGSTTEDGSVTLEDVECIAACTEGPCLQANYRYVTKLDNEKLDDFLVELRAGNLSDDIPDHGTVARIRQHIPADRAAGPSLPEGGAEPAWMATPAPEDASDPEGGAS
jgi:NADH-quinone oxidoreductase subunit E